MTQELSGQSFALLTPCFCAGVHKTRPEMRLPSIRGQLRWWTRVIHGPGEPEYRLFGGIHGIHHRYEREGVASSFKLALEELQGNPAPRDYCLVPHKQDRAGFWAQALPPGSEYTLTWAAQPHPDFHGKPEVPGSPAARQRFENVLKAWLLLGTLGRRATRASGSVWPVDFAPTTQDFKTAVASLGLPPDIRVEVLNSTEKPQEDAETLRAFADLTVHGLRRHGITGDPLGYVAGPERKASPLRFKVGRFDGGFRLIAVWDNRNGRGGSLAAAKVAMQANGGRQLAAWLDAAGF